MLHLLKEWWTKRIRLSFVEETVALPNAGRVANFACHQLHGGCFDFPRIDGTTVPFTEMTQMTQTSGLFWLNQTSTPFQAW